MIFNYIILYHNYLPLPHFSFPVLSFFPLLSYICLYFLHYFTLLYFTLFYFILFYINLLYFFYFSNLFLGTFAGLLGRVTSLSCTGSTYNIYILRYFYFRCKLKKWRAILQNFMIRFFTILFFIYYFFFLMKYFEVGICPFSIFFHSFFILFFLFPLWKKNWIL